MKTNTNVNQIILQHHEVNDGTGFPRSLNAARIGQLPSLFIMVEDFVEFIDQGEDVESSIQEFQKKSSAPLKKI